MIERIPDLLALIEPHAVVLALALPPVIRIVGHWLPEELFMIVMGVVAARSGSLEYAVILLGAVTLSHFLTDQATYLAGRWLRPRFERFPKIASKLEAVTRRLCSSRGAILGLIPARVLPLGRGAWMAGCGVVEIPWSRFAVVDTFALLVHLATWSGLGWWLSHDLGRLEYSAEVGKVVGMWSAVALVLGIGAVIAWRTRTVWLPVRVSLDDPPRRHHRS